MFSTPEYNEEKGNKSVFLSSLCFLDSLNVVHVPAAPPTETDAGEFTWACVCTLSQPPAGPTQGQSRLVCTWESPDLFLKSWVSTLKRSICKGKICLFQPFHLNNRCVSLIVPVQAPRQIILQKCLISLWVDDVIVQVGYKSAGMQKFQF